jgi:cell wall-associated NlpC family hydrolase
MVLMTLARSRSAAILAVLIAAPAALHAQRIPAFAPYVARNTSLPGSPELVGLALASRSGILGVRISGGLRASLDSLQQSQLPVRAWTADADLMLTPGGVAQLLDLLGGFDVAGFVGVGRQGVVDRVTGKSSASADWSYGAALSRRIVGPLALTTEARYRVPFAAANELPPGFSRNWEYRVGLGLGLGSRKLSGARRSRSASFPISFPAPPATASAKRVLATADDYVGTPYSYGGTSPSNGFDCSGFVQYVFNRHGVRLPRTSRQQASAGAKVPARVGAFSAGDLLLFAGNGSRIDHVAIYAGRNRIIHATSSGGGVLYDDLSSRRGAWFLDHLVAARRVMAGGRSLVGDVEWGLSVLEMLDPPDRAPEAK